MAVVPQDATDYGDLLPLDLGTGVSAGGVATTTTATLLNSGLTVSANHPTLGLNTTSENTAEQPADATASVLRQSPSLPSTPNSDRFLLMDRQENLSLAKDVDTADIGVKLKESQFVPPPVTTPTKPTPAQTMATMRTAEAPADPVVIETLDLPAAESSEDADILPLIVKPSERFSKSSADIGASSVVLNSERFTHDGTPQTVPVGVIHTSSDSGAIIAGDSESTGQPTLGQILEGEVQSGTLGSDVPGISPWRSVAVLFLCLGLIFVAVAAAKRGMKSPFKLGKDKSLKVIETISLGTGRQITIVEMGDSALILGMTPQNINLLDKVPLASMDTDYQRTVNDIIAKESRAPKREWEAKPSFDMRNAPVAPSLAPPLKSSDAYGANGKRISVSELRRVRADRVEGGRTFIDPAKVGSKSDSGAKAVLIGRVREQLSRLED